VNFNRRYWDGKLITGVFSPHTVQKGAVEARARLHFIGFVNEKAYGKNEFGPAIQFIANPHLFSTVGEARTALKGWPLKPLIILNAPSLWERVSNSLRRGISRARRLFNRGT
jgi:hypothetical protein